jgi:hypothetical protein
MVAISRLPIFDTDSHVECRLAVTKRIVCLANSRKLSGRCIAGKEFSAGSAADWIRPVSARPHEEVSEHERRYEDGSDPKLMDILDIPLLQAKPNFFQSENWLLDDSYYWHKHRRANWDELITLADPVAPLWVNGTSTYHGVNDQIELATANNLTSSLRLIHVDQLTLHVFVPGAKFNDLKRRVQAIFHHDGVRYKLWVTDPIYERRYLAKSDGQYHLGEICLTISIGEPAKDGFCYKLVAAIIEKSEELD